MMIRKANNKDIPQIIEVLKAGLGEGLIKKTEKIWRFKHLDNPFGESLVLVAEKDHKIVGVRAFMQWRWQQNQQIWTAYRAVDTATHPDYQRQGIFKKLTLNALEIAQNISESFVFNTPNENSRPGYLKMGWKQVGKIKVSLIPVFLYLPYALSKQNDFQNNQKHWQQLCDYHNRQLQSSAKIFTPKSPEYLTWRYVNNPMQSYEIVSGENFFIAYYIKSHRFFNELRISENIILPGAPVKDIRKKIIKEAFQNKCLLISTAKKELFNWKIFGNFGPILTFKPLTGNKMFINEALSINNWYYSLGDLELF
jgi:N-acetylglutamate synthase-like GNAT family acetyltransferase